MVAFSLASQPKSSKPDETNEQDYVSVYTSTFFRWAVYHGHTALVALLLSEQVTWYGDLLRKADSDEDSVGLVRRTLKYINDCGNEETAQLLLDSVLKSVDRNEREFEALCESTQAGWEMVVRLLLRGTESLKLEQIKNGDNALHIAAWNNHSIVVEECLKLGFDIDAKGMDGETPLMTAISSNSEQVVTLLVDKGAKANPKNVRGKRITHAALMSSLSEEIVQRVLAKAFEAHSLEQSHLSQPNTKWRRADVIVDLDSVINARIHIFVDSYYAFFEAPQRFYLRVAKSRKYVTLNDFYSSRMSKDKLSILFHPYPNAGLDISVIYFGTYTQREPRLKGSKLREWKERQRNRRLRFRIVNGGEFSINLGDAYQVLYHSFKDIATDPNAELVDLDKHAFPKDRMRAEGLIERAAYFRGSSGGSQGPTTESYPRQVLNHRVIPLGNMNE